MRIKTNLARMVGIALGLSVIGAGVAQSPGEEPGDGEFLLLDEGPGIEDVAPADDFGGDILMLDDGADGGVMVLDDAAPDRALDIDDADLSPTEVDATDMEGDMMLLDDGSGETVMLLDDGVDEAAMVLDDDAAPLDEGLEPGDTDLSLAEPDAVDDAGDDVMILDGGGPEPAAGEVADADVMMLDDELGLDDLDGDLGEMAGQPDAAAGEGGVMVLGEDSIEISAEDDALLQDLDAEMAGFDGMAGAAGAGMMMVDDADSGLPTVAGPEMDGLDADLAGMLGAPADDGGGDLVLDDGGESDGALVLDDGLDPGMDPGAGAELALDDAVGEPEAEEEYGLSVYAVLKNESAVFIKSGTPTGSEKSTLGGGDHNGGRLFKSEFSLNIFANAQITENALVHAQLNLTYDPKADPNWYRGPQFYTQNDPLRELYLETTVPLIDDQGILMRLGKQQVVWGTADGIKLLDIVNPTDFRELVQNTFEDSRIPVTMLNLERNIGDSGNVQLIVAENRKNRIPGLDSDGDSGHPFIMKGVDSITGSVNGFLNIGPALGKVADAFNRLSAISGSPIGLTPLSFVTVDDFATNNPVAQSIFGAACSPSFNPSTPTSATCLKDITERPDETLAPGAVLPGGDNQFVTNLIDADTQSDWDTNNPNSAFEYMSNATFATFNTFVSAKSRYEVEEPDSINPNIGGRWKSTLGSNFNYSLNYFYAYDANPSVSISWRNNAGETLKVKKVKAQAYVDAGILAGLPAGTADRETIILKDSAGRTYGAFDGDPTSPGFGGPGAGAPTLVFTEERHRAHNLGASFDYALDTASLGSFVLRGEFLYQNGIRVPLVNRKELGIGNITEGLKPDEVNFFKYVLGAETIVFTNLTLSAQFIQFVNLNFKNGNDVYHGNQAVLHLSNGLKKGYKYQNFGSLFLSKPFGVQQDGRINNIIIAERGGGYWNRLDVEYRFTDQFIGSAELNTYFGDRDTMFGQFRDSSNFQIGLKYIFE